MYTRDCTLRSKRSFRGLPYLVCERNVPYLLPFLLDCCTYHYPSLDDARNGAKLGGTGFLVEIPFTSHPDVRFCYAVTNSHIIREARSPVFRVNTTDGGFDIIERDEKAWVHHTDGDDIAACFVGLSTDHKVYPLPLSAFLTPDDLSELVIGPGADVVMIGRFMAHEGKERNLPTVRFGNIAMMPSDIPNPRGIRQLSFLVEMRSMGGYSGSPVFTYFQADGFVPKPGDDLSGKKGSWVTDDHPQRSTASNIRLLGIDWGHLPSWEQVREKPDSDYGHPPPVSEGWVVQSNTGMACVAPAWKIAELLNQEELVIPRGEKAQEVVNDLKNAGVFDMEEPTVDDEATRHKTPAKPVSLYPMDEEEALKRLLRVPPPEKGGKD